MSRYRIELVEKPHQPPLWHVKKRFLGMIWIKQSRWISDRWGAYWNTTSVFESLHQAREWVEVDQSPALAKTEEQT